MAEWPNFTINHPILRRFGEFGRFVAETT